MKKPKPPLLLVANNKPCDDCNSPQTCACFERCVLTPLPEEPEPNIRPHTIAAE